MFYSTTSSVFFVAFLLLIAVGPSISRPLSNRATASTPASSHRRSFRRASSSLIPPPLLRRSTYEGMENDELPSPIDPLFPPDDPISNLRRSLGTDSADPQDDNSTDQERADAEKDWEEFVASTPDEDASSYPDAFAQEEEVDSSCSGDGEKDALQEAPNPPTNIVTPNDSGKDKSSVHQSDSDNKPPKSNDSEAAKKKDAQAANKGDPEAAQQSDADDKQRKQADATKQQQADVDKEKKAEADKKKQAEADKEKQAEADKEKQAEADKEKQAEADKEKQAEADKEKQAEAEKQKKADEEKQKEADVAQAKKDAEQAEGAKNKQAASKAPDSYQITDVKPVPGTAVTTGTAHKDHSADSYSTPSGEIHTGDATCKHVPSVALEMRTDHERVVFAPSMLDYEPDLGACGITNHPTDMIVAVSHLLYDSFPSQGGNPNTNAVCGKKIRASYKGNSVDVTVVDRCEGCGYDSLDFTITAFEQLGSKEEGRLHGMTWTWI
ncbi:hypothetical protein VP01_784g10 [Puccinia sorghi]|uniref:RlpA-like protein double-psi beta-barrel domain-containing protein n=1 Tax=Puccinia sorghi TaxID=27349 RepID=A0A0L6UBW3_9BASI|nr:hypothetical protein VP01_784g10 [Puccinia sorghi]